jgi:hypothetical protein
MIRCAMASLRPAPISLLLCGALAGTGLALGAAAKEPPLPSGEELRQLQLLTVACGRDNTAEPCQKARNQADPLMDHPRLSGSCKDALWTIREKAVVVPSNNYERRQLLTRAGTDVPIFCKPQAQPVKPKADDKAGSQKRSGFGLLQGN